MVTPRINKVLISLLVILLFFLQYCLWFAKDGIRDLLRVKQVLAQQSAENDQLKQTNEELVFQIQRLQRSEDAVETRARDELGMIKKGETFYQVVG
ncbi:MAG TPA: septum formation initiator family protein [Gammaproteobacteria bacterium]|jgi:cell division protein FtsB|nr:septum formation initiator family protein [Gammaproteobacteria bacterium]